MMSHSAFGTSEVKYHRAAKKVRLPSSVRPVDNFRQLLFMFPFFGKEAISTIFATHVKVHRLDLLPFMLKFFHIIT